MLGALKLIELAIPAAVGIVVGWVFATLYADVVSIPAAREAGQIQERIVWQERQRRAEIKADANKAAAQTAINRIEADYHQREVERTAQLTALNQALQEEQANAPISVPDTACRAVIPRRVLDSLDGVGRASPRGDPPFAHPRVP